jgi:aspartate aminotransferase
VIDTPPPTISRRMDRVKQSSTISVMRKLRALRRDGVEVLNLASGEPDWPTPPHIVAAAKEALDRGATRYTELYGMHSLRVALVDWLKRVHGLDFAVDQVMVSAGAKQVLYNLFQALLEDGDEVIVPAPCWTSYPDLVRAAGGAPVLVRTEADSGFLPEVEATARAVTPRTRALVLCTPANPTGAVYPEALVRELVTLCARHRLLVVTDDIYRTLIYGDARAVSVAQLAHQAGAPFVIVDGVSKMYRMTGFRIGFGAAHPRLIAAMGVLQSQTISCSTTVSQHAALAAITGPQECVEELRLEFDRRRRLMIERVRALPHVRLKAEPLGAFYVFPDVRGLCGARTPEGATLDDDVAIAQYLLEKTHVAVVPGSGFESPGFLRLSYATPPEQVQAGVDRMRELFATLTPPAQPKGDR